MFQYGTPFWGGEKTSSLGRKQVDIDNVPLPLRATTQEIRRLCDELELMVGKPRSAMYDIRLPYSSLPPPQLDDKNLADFAELLIKERDKRGRHFKDIEFFDPSWSILLDLFVNQYRGIDVSVSSLCIAARVPPTTALRYISFLTSTEVLIRVQDPQDARRVFLRLPDAVVGSLRAYLQEIFSARSAFTQDMQRQVNMRTDVVATGVVQKM
jgi:hypothetical protein